MYGDTILGFYWGDAETLKFDAESHFQSDLANLTDATLIGWILAIITGLWTTFWVTYHCCWPHSYKFEFHWLSKLSIRVHITAGSLEFILMYAAYFWTGAIEPFVYAIVCLDVLHCTTAFYQLPQTFGQKLITIPTYVWMASFKLALSLYLSAQPNSKQRFMALYYSHSQFVWFRIFYWVMGWKFRLFKGSLYTMSLMATALFSQAFISGTSGVLIYTLYIFLVIPVLLRCRPRLVAGGKREATQNAVQQLSSEEIEYLRGELSKYTAMRDKMGVIFDFIDENGDGMLDLIELHRWFTQCGVTVSTAVRIFESIDTDNSRSIDKDEFCASEGCRKLVQQLENDIVEETEFRATSARAQTIRGLVNSFAGSATATGNDNEATQ